MLAVSDVWIVCPPVFSKTLLESISVAVPAAMVELRTETAVYALRDKLVGHNWIDLSYSIHHSLPSLASLLAGSAAQTLP
jgi:hypothetical protein